MVDLNRKKIEVYKGEGLLNTRIVTVSQNVDLIPVFDPFLEQFPEFIQQGDAISRYYWNELYTTFPDYQFALYGEDEEMVGCGHTIPLYWDGTKKHIPGGYDHALKQGFDTNKPNTLCALAAVSSTSHKGKGLSYDIIRTMKAIAKKNGLTSVIAPVRPTWKQKYPTIPIEHYAHWKRDDGAPFDPWLRVHWRLGGRQLGIAPRSMMIKGTVSEWSEWTGMALPESGQYVVPGALSLVKIDCDKDCGLYDDPNVWVEHRV